MTDDPLEPRDDDSDSEDSGGWSKAFTAVFISTLVYPIARVLRPVPLVGSKLWKTLAVKSLYHYHKAAGGDRVGLETTPSNQIKLTPVKWRGNDAVDDDEKPGWKAKGRDKTWKPTTLGQTGPRLGRTPVIPLDSESWKTTSILEADIAEAVDQGETRPLYRVDDARLSAEIGPAGQAGGQASAPVADGGMAVQNIEFDPRSSPIFEDVIVNLGSDDYDGMAVSWWKAKELLLEQTTTEEMANQEERGFLAGRSKQDIMRWMWKIFLVAGLVAIAGLIGKELVFALLGGGGGGGGGSGMIPLILAPLGL